MAKGKLITTHLVDGDPNGTQYMVIGNKICQMFVVPRSNFTVLNYQDELQKLQTPACYILIGEDATTKTRAYIGETDNFSVRVKDHENKKDFWQKAIIFVSRDKNSSLTKSDVQYLEYLSLSVARKTNKYVLKDNKQAPKCPFLPTYRKEVLEDFFDDIQFLTSFIGCNIFEIVKPEDKHLFFLKRRGCEAQGFYDTDGFTVLQGSVIASDSTPSYKGSEKRKIQVEELTREDKNKKRVLSLNKTFSSPSTAAVFCIGGNANGWDVWCDREGNTLDDIYRKPLK